MRTLAEGSTNSPRAKRTQASLRLRRSRNPKGCKRNEVSLQSNPSLVLREGKNSLSLREEKTLSRIERGKKLEEKTLSRIERGKKLSLLERGKNSLSY